MKLRFLFFAAFIVLASCSNDDSKDVTNPIEVNTLKEVSYYNGQFVSELIKFENNKMKERNIYNEQGDIEYKDIYSYDGKGRLLSRKFSPGYGSAEQSLIYDNLGRIGFMQLIQGSLYKEEVSFDYSEQNKIKAIKSIFIDTEVSTILRTAYHLLPDGRVYKIVTNNKEIEAIYEGNNITSLITRQIAGGEIIYSNTLSLEYDNTREVKGEFLNMYSNLFGDNKANNVIYNESFQLAKDKYITSANANANELMYEFNTNGFPVQQTFYAAGQYYSKYVISYN